MTTLTQTKQKFRGSQIGADSPLPSLTDQLNIQGQIKHGLLPEGDTLFSGYGRLQSVYPYSQQNNYNRTLTDMEIDVIILENDYIKATFLPTYGGRLWSLWDKKHERELLYVNDVLRPSNLAVRNAWISGGIEWNCGIIGHSPFTCAPMFTATYEVNGTPILRFYQWERIRNITYSIDFFLPDDSQFLINRVRIHNPNPEIVPMYWWSNTAVPEHDKGRIAVLGTSAYVRDSARTIMMEQAPINGEEDFSYPVNTKNGKDYFYFLPDEKRKYEGYIMPDGIGLIQTSTAKLKGRKLFVWGQNTGGKKWQSFLTENAGSYIEIQAGLERTQYGCVPMQPYGTWEFSEAYGALEIMPDEQKASYPTFLSAVEAALENILPEKQFEAWLNSTVESMGQRYVTAVTYGSGDAALESSLRKKFGLNGLNDGLDFGKSGTEHVDFEHLLLYGYMPSHDASYIPTAHVSGVYWLKLLEAAAKGPDRDNWLTFYHLGLVYFSEGQRSSVSDALTALKRAADICANGSVLYALAVMYEKSNEKQLAVSCAMKSCRIFGGNLSVTKAVMELMSRQQAYDSTAVLYDSLPAEIKADTRVGYMYITALVYLNHCDEALEILQNSDYVIDDVREGENSMFVLWDEIVSRTGRKDLRFPEHLNFKAIV